MEWQCANGHQWYATLNSVKNMRTWGPQCARKSSFSLDDATQIAYGRGGYCLSRHYTNTTEKLRWQCASGHTWSANLNNVKNNGTWCPECSRFKNENDIKHIFEQIFTGFNFITCRPSFLKRHTGGRLELDGYCAALGIAFEYNGEQHYDAKHFWNSKSSFA